MTLFPTRNDEQPRFSIWSVLLLLTVLGLLVATPAMAAEAAEAAEAVEAGESVAAPGTGKSWGAFFGRTHVLFLHLPIGLLMGAFAIEFFGLFKRTKGYDIAAAWLFVFGAMSAVFAVFTGMLLGTEQAATNAVPGQAPGSIFALLFADSIEQGVSETLGWHMWLGITLMLAAIVAAVLKVLSVRKQWKDKDSAIPHSGGWSLVVARLSILGSMTALPFVGHLGGNITHGPEFLVERTPISVPDWMVYWPEVPPQTADAVPEGEVKIGTVAYWNVNIQPVMNQRCTDCHNASNQKGKLRLDSLEWAMKGGNVGGTIEPGDAEFSEIYRRVILPPSHEEFMPTNVKKYGMMTQEEVHMLGEWLMAFDGDLDDGSTAPEDSGQENSGSDSSTQAPPKAKPLVDPALLSAIEEAGGSARSLSQSQKQLAIKYAYLKELDPRAVALLGETADLIAWITFEGSALNDEGLKQLPDLPELTELNLKDTKITDAGLAELPDLPSLAWLNLFGTEVTDAAVDSLKAYDTLEKLYVTGTKMTADGVKKLRDALPDTKVFSDHDGIFTFPSDTPEGPKPGETQPPKEQASAKPINDKCPVSGAGVKAGFVSTFKGKTVGFCCNNCKGKFDAEPAKFAAKLPK